jgi:mono/diheme cytochrome c family protein
VPVTGRETAYASPDEYAELAVPDLYVASYDSVVARRLYNVNCQPCHGPTLRGFLEPAESERAKMLKFINRGPLPVDLRGKSAVDASNGDLFAFISYGGRQGYSLISQGRATKSPMPAFRLLLTEEERWTLVIYLRSMQKPDG